MFSHALNWAYRASRTIKWTSITLFCLIGMLIGLLGVWMLAYDMSSPLGWMCAVSGLMCFYMLLVLASEWLPDYSDDCADEPLVKLGQGDNEQWMHPSQRTKDVESTLPEPPRSGSGDKPLLFERMKRLSSEELEAWKKKQAPSVEEQK